MPLKSAGMAVGQTWVPKMEPWQVETWSGVKRSNCHAATLASGRASHTAWAGRWGLKLIVPASGQKPDVIYIARFHDSVCHLVSFQLLKVKHIFAGRQFPLNNKAVLERM